MLTEVRLNARLALADTLELFGRAHVNLGVLARRIDVDELLAVEIFHLDLVAAACDEDVSRVVLAGDGARVVCVRNDARDDRSVWIATEKRDDDLGPFA